MSYSSLDEVFNKYITNPINYELYQQIKIFRISWAQKTEEYIEFLGNNLIGVYNVAFSFIDQDNFFSLFNIYDIKPLQKDLYMVKGINKSFKVVSNALNLTLVWLMHKFTIAKNLDKKLREDAVRELFSILSYKFLGSLNSHYFKYSVDPSVARAVNERMSGKWLLRKFNSIQEIIEYKALDVLPKGIHEHRVEGGSPDDATRIISDIQTKYRDIYKGVYGILLEVNEQNEKIVNSSLLESSEDGESFKSITTRPDQYWNHVMTLLPLQHDFISEDIVTLFCGIYKNIKYNVLMELLKYIVDNYQKEKELLNKIEECFIIYLEYFKTKDITNYQKQVYECIMIMRGYFSSGIINNKTFAENKKFLLRHVKKLTKQNNNTVIVNLSSSLVMYFVVRSFFK